MPSQSTTPLPAGLREMLEASEKMPLEQDPDMQAALDRFRMIAGEIETQREK